ncbi:MAG: hypothetical protein HRT35_19900 [Algicola sp.]|nr:hypothetical protein [Algicola sp.]
MAIRKRGLTVEHGALLACGVATERELVSFYDCLKGNHSTRFVDVGEGRSLACTPQNEAEIRIWFTDLVELLQEDLILLKDLSYHQSNPEQFAKPSRTTPIQTIKLIVGTNFCEYEGTATEYINYDSSLMTYESLAQWFICHNELKMALRISPLIVEKYYYESPFIDSLAQSLLLTPQTNKDPLRNTDLNPLDVNYMSDEDNWLACGLPFLLLPSEPVEVDGINDYDIALITDYNSNQKTDYEADFEADDIPTNLYLAYGIFKDVWSNIPQDMRSPTKAQMIDYLKTRGVSVAADVEAIIRLSKPDDVTFGGHGDASKLKWKPQNKRQN